MLKLDKLLNDDKVLVDDELKLEAVDVLLLDAVLDDDCSSAVIEIKLV